MGMLSVFQSEGWFIRRRTVLIVGLVFLISLIVVGVVVYHVAPRTDEDTSAEADDAEKSSSLHDDVLPKDVRLPRHLVPYKYDVKLKPLFDDKHTIEGETTIDMQCKQDAYNVTVHMKDIEVLKKPQVLDEKGQALRIKYLEGDMDRDFYIVQLKDELQSGRNYSIYFKFTANLSDKLTGFYRSKYKTEDGKEKVLAVSQLGLTDSRRAFPCFDEPEFKAKFTISLGRRKNMNSVSNMRIKTTEPEKGNDEWVWDHYEESFKMSTYLLAFLISEFHQQLVMFDAEWTSSVYARPEAIRKEETKYAGYIMPRILKFFEGFYSIPYPFPKLDMAAIPDFKYGAMENWGLIMYRDARLLYDPNVSSAEDKKNIALVVAHELSHQWFGDLVTPLWWTDIWLNEGFATYMQFLGVNHVQPTWRMEEALLSEDMHDALMLDSLRTSHPISIEVNHPDEIGEILDEISYQKGASVIRMMSYFLTEDTLRKGLTKYLKEFSYSNAEQDDLWHHMTMQGHEDETLDQDVAVKTIMDTWTLQMGYPVVDVERSNDGKSAVLKQSRFFLAPGNETSDDHVYSWWIPVTHTNAGEKDFSKENAKPTRWIPKDTKMITVDNMAKDNKDWIIVNIQQAGYYRVNYDARNWELLTKQFNTDYSQIPPIQRCQVLDDAFNLARAGYLPYSTTLPFVEYLTEEDEYYPIRTVVYGLTYIDNMLDRSAAYNYFKKFMKKIIYPMYNQLDISTLKTMDKSYPTIADTQKNVTIFKEACFYDNEDCIRVCKDMLKRFRDNYDPKAPDKSSNQIHPDLKSVVYCNGIKHGEDDDWEFLWNHYKLTSVASEKNNVLKALACSNQMWILSSFLDKILEDDEIRAQDGLTVYNHVAINPVGRLMAWDFYRENFDKIKTKFGKVAKYGSMIKSVTASMNTQLQLDEVKALKEEHDYELTTATRATEQSIEIVGNNLMWMKTNYDSVFKWLKENQ